MRIRTYTELREFQSFINRYNYLKLYGTVGQASWGSNRYVNQALYKSRRWRDVRDEVIARDRALDLGVPGYLIPVRAVIHHMNPITVEDVISESLYVFSPEYLITTTERTHQAIHFGDSSLLPQVPISRRLGDTTPWE
jgi:hypothetical protein